MGAITNIATAILISRVKLQTLAVVSALVTLIAPILMATVTIGENYWFAPFWALFLSPVNPDGNNPCFTRGNKSIILTRYHLHSSIHSF